MVWGPGYGWSGAQGFDSGRRGRQQRPEVKACSPGSGSGPWKPPAHVVCIRSRRLPPSAKAQQLGAQLNSLFAGSWANEGGRPGSCRLSPLDQMPEIAGQPQATGCRLRTGEAGLLRAAQDPWGELTLRPLGPQWPKQTASTCPQRSLSETVYPGDTARSPRGPKAPPASPPISLPPPSLLQKGSPLNLILLYELLKESARKI